MQDEADSSNEKRKDNYLSQAFPFIDIDIDNNTN